MRPFQNPIYPSLVISYPIIKYKRGTLDKNKKDNAQYIFPDKAHPDETTTTETRSRQDARENGSRPHQEGDKVTRDARKENKLTDPQFVQAYREIEYLLILYMMSDSSNMMLKKAVDKVLISLKKIT